ncbi:MAG: CHC2 zinc finger domain-containing protein, partial [Pseudomonadota bacterium]
MSSDIIADIKDRLPLLEYLGRDGLQLRRDGTTYKACCPFHDEKTGSFTVFPKTDSYYCFGCQAHGDLFTYCQARQNCDFHEALRVLAREAGVQLAESPEQQEAVRKLRERGEILMAAATHYHAQLGPEQRVYLHGRGFRDDFLDSYLFGYAAGNVIRQALKDVSVETLKEIGLLRENGADFFVRRIVIPVYGRSGIA